MIKLISLLLIALYAILPTSPIQSAFAEMDMDGEFLGWLNWFIPFDLASKITTTWLICIVAYYAFTTVKKVVMEYIVGKLVS